VLEETQGDMTAEEMRLWGLSAITPQSQREALERMRAERGRPLDPRVVPQSEGGVVVQSPPPTSAAQPAAPTPPPWLVPALQGVEKALDAFWQRAGPHLPLLGATEEERNYAGEVQRKLTHFLAWLGRAVLGEGETRHE
jgi:hypothetical protein